MLPLPSVRRAELRSGRDAAVLSGSGSNAAHSRAAGRFPLPHEIGRVRMTTPAGSGSNDRLWEHRLKGEPRESAHTPHTAHTPHEASPPIAGPQKPTQPKLAIPDKNKALTICLRASRAFLMNFRVRTVTLEDMVQLRLRRSMQSSLNGARALAPPSIGFHPI